MTLTVVRSIGPPRRLATAQEYEDFEQELVDQFLLAGVGAGMADSSIADDRRAIFEYVRFLGRPAPRGPAQGQAARAQRSPKQGVDARAVLRLPDRPLPGRYTRGGLKPAAKNLLAAVDALPDPSDAAVLSAAAPPADEPAAGGPRDGSPAPQRAADKSADLRRIRVAAEVLRGQLTTPGDFHRATAAGIAEGLMGVALGVYHEQALVRWGAVYGRTSGTLHGGEADLAGVYREVLLLARELLVPLHGRATRVLELTALKAPGKARGLAGWADPRATKFFFGFAPAAAWLGALQDHAPHLLLADETAGTWPAAPFPEHPAAPPPRVAGQWLARRAAEFAPAGPHVLGALLRLADAVAPRPGGTGCSRTSCPRPGPPSRPSTRTGRAGWRPAGRAPSRCLHGTGTGSWSPRNC